MYKLLAALLCVPLLAACTKEPPKCSDPATLTLVKQILLDKLGVNEADREKIGVELLYAILSLENPRSSAYDEKIKKLSCEATLIVKSNDEAGNTYQLPLDFESQLDDKGDHIVAVKGVMIGDLRQVDQYVGAAIVNARKKAGVAESVVTPPETAAAEPAPAGGTEPEQPAEASTETSTDVPDTVEKSGVCKGLDLAINVEQSECLSRKFTIADKTLNDEYKRVMASLPAERQAELRGSQRAWIKEKDQKCAQAGDEFEGGTLQPIVIADCEVRMTDERSKFLANYQ
ncbi:lysozyme inhibitor LprI family protein [Massilia sp.]|uniref:lysozyme inhibitor LprI family protein n=1 Tax=Massilia sp. TaxID=1882437 RepID=UPI0028AE4526|nr:lysozyme inhibitor LprI family protein [Massilia sp.]